MSASKKPHLNMIVTGHIDNGKSTSMGHMLMDLGLIDERTIAAHAAESEKVIHSSTHGLWTTLKTKEKEVSQ